MLQCSNKGQSDAQKTRELIEQGILPEGLSLTKILAELKETKAPNILEAFGFLSLKHYRKGELLKDYGLVSCQLVTVAFTNYLVDALQDSTTYPMDVFKYHGSGTGTTAEANTQTALVTEVESRETGTQVEGATANIYKSVATETYTATRSITEHGLFSAVTSGTMLDRSVFTAVPVVATDTIEFTYQLTVNAET